MPMTYIDCFLTPVPRANRANYEALAHISADVVMAHGALRLVECWLDDAGPDASTYHGESVRAAASSYPTFPAAVGAAADDTVVMSWVEWPDKRARDEGMALVTADPRMQFSDLGPTFDGRRLIAAGFVPMIVRP
jgi:uncharacterized protein YbaA (DUF1428 family)